MVIFLLLHFIFIYSQKDNKFHTFQFKSIEIGIVTIIILNDNGQGLTPCSKIIIGSELLSTSIYRMTNTLILFQ